MADAEESTRFRRAFTAYCPEGHMCNMGGKHLKYSKTLSDARHKLAQHLHNVPGHSTAFQDWEFCLTAAAREMYIVYKYDAEADKWSDPVEVWFEDDEGRSDQEAQDRACTSSRTPDAPQPKRPRQRRERRDAGCPLLGCQHGPATAGSRAGPEGGAVQLSLHRCRRR